MSDCRRCERTLKTVEIISSFRDALKADRDELLRKFENLVEDEIENRKERDALKKEVLWISETADNSVRKNQEHVEKLKAERDDFERLYRNTRAMLSGSPEELKALRGYQELGAKCAALEGERDALKAEVERLNRMRFNDVAPLIAALRAVDKGSGLCLQEPGRPCGEECVLCRVRAALEKVGLE